MKKLLTPILMLTLIIASCSTAMVPIGSNTQPGEPLALQVIVGQELPKFDRSDPYTPIHVTLRNTTNRRINLRYAYFTLVDPAGRQFVIAPVERVVDWIRYENWSRYYRPYYPSPIGRYVFREGMLKPGREIQAVVFFHQATRYGQGTYRMIVNIPENRRPLEFAFKLY
jgi:hypothetical protein